MHETVHGNGIYTPSVTDLKYTTVTPGTRDIFACVKENKIG